MLLWKREGRTIAIGENMLEKVSARYDLETEENGSSLVIRGVEAGDGGQYTCQVSVHLYFKELYCILARYQHT